MARLIKATASVILWCLVSASADAQIDISSGIPDPEAVRAYRDYWSALEEYEANAAANGNSKLRAIYDRINREENEQSSRRTREQIEFLVSASEKYKRHLDEFPEATNRQYVILNYARMIDRIAGIEQEINADRADGMRKDVLSRLRDFEQSYPDAAMRDEVSALRAVLLEKTGMGDDAIAVWHALARRDRVNQSVLAANIASGDYAFDKVDYRSALDYYERAGRIVSGLAKSAENRKMAVKAAARVNYRIGWAAYKSGALDKTIAAASALLEPHLDVFSDKERQGIQRDAAELLGDALYEERDLVRTRKILSRPTFSLVAASSGLRVVRRLGSSRQFGRLSELGTFLLDKFPNSGEVPWLVDLTAAGLEQSGNIAAAMAIRARIVNLLPNKSLWRAINRENIDALAALRRIGVVSGQKAAAWYYEEGIESGSQSSFKTSASIYQTLLDENLSDKDANEWRLRIANCNYFQNNLVEARRLYAELKSEYALDRKLLELTAYQDVLAAERVWKDKLATATVAGRKPLDDEVSKSALKQLIGAIDDFNSRFPGQKRSNDLLLVGASAFRDQGLVADAEKYWQRVLVANPTAAQRGLAIRGLVQAELMISPHAEVVAVVSKFLKLEDWEKLGSGLRQEMEGILSSAAIDEGSRLNQDGNVLEAGTLLVQTAMENPGIPQREKLIRDGAYLLALGGAWAEARKTATGYSGNGMKKYAGDMEYLVARADEYLLKLGRAAGEYLQFAQRHPKHTRSEAALDRAEKLALANNDFKVAALAASVRAGRAKTREKRLDGFRRSVAHAEQGGANREARKYAAMMLKESRDLPERFSSQFALGKIAVESGDVQQGIDNLEILARRIEQDRYQLGGSFAGLSGRVNLYLGEHFNSQLDAIRIDGKDANVASVLERKLKLFDEVMMRYDRAAASGDRRSAPVARFKAGSAADLMAHDIERSGRAGIDLKSRENVSRLQSLAKNYFSANLMAARKNPGAYRGNEWVARSGLKIDGGNESRVAASLSEEVPLITNPDLPAQWRM